MSKKIYGIDLGTTNSIIGCDNRLISRLVSSKVNFTDRCVVPHDLVGDNIVGSYKVDMGLGDEGLMSIDASSIVLRELCRQVKEYNGDTVEDVIISVPAYFSSNQRVAVRVAAEKVGLNLISVINEPTAAALQICSKGYNNSIRRGVFVVYDLGGGTFDCTIIDSRSGKYSVVGTDGCILGGDNLDRAIANEVMKRLKVPIFKRDKFSVAMLTKDCEIWKRSMQEAYINFKEDDYVSSIKVPGSMTEDGKTYLMNMSLRTYKQLVRDTFGGTASIMYNLIDNKVPKGTDITVVFVGGSTHDTYLCYYILQSCNISMDHAEFDLNPDFTVAMGVVKYATYIQNGNEDIEFKDVTKQLSIEDMDGRAVVIIPANTTIPCSKTKIVTNSNDTDTLRVRLYQGNSAIASNNEYIGYLEYNYDEFKKAGEGDVEVTISVDISGFITLEVEDIISFGEKKTIKLRGF